MEQRPETVTDLTPGPNPLDGQEPVARFEATGPDPWEEAASGSRVPRIGIAGGAVLGGGTLLLLVRRRARRRREAARRKRVEAATALAAARAKDAASTVGSAATTVGTKLRGGMDRIADDRKVRTYAIAGAGAAWLYLKLAEVR